MSWVLKSYDFNLSFLIFDVIIREIRKLTLHISLIHVRPSKKKKHMFLVPRPLHFLAPPLLFYYFFMSNVFMSKNQQTSLLPCT